MTLNWRHTITSIQQALKIHYSAPLSIIFKQFRIGAVLFFIGGILIWQASLQEPSSAQELIVLIGLILGGAGFIIAITAQVRHIISRILRFFDQS